MIDLTPLLNTGTLDGPHFYREGRRAITAAGPERTILIRRGLAWDAAPVAGADLITAYDTAVKGLTMPECYFIRTELLP